MDFFLCKLVFISRVFVVTPIGFYNDFIMITDFSNKVLKNNLTEGSQSSSRSLLDCSTQCGQCCGCFEFNILTNVSCIQKVRQSWYDGIWGRLDLSFHQRISRIRWDPFYSTFQITKYVIKYTTFNPPISRGRCWFLYNVSFFLLLL